MFGEEQKRDCEQKDADRNGGAQRPIVRRTKETLDNVGNHDAGWATNEERAKKIAHCEDKSEGGAGQKSRQRERKNDTQKRGARAGTEVVRGFDEVSRDVLERSVQRKKDKGRLDVRKCEDDRERAVEEKANGLVDQVELLEEAVKDSVGAKNGFPGITANQVADPQGHDDQLIEKFFSWSGVE